MMKELKRIGRCVQRRLMTATLLLLILTGSCVNLKAAWPEITMSPTGIPGEIRFDVEIEDPGESHFSAIVLTGNGDALTIDSLESSFTYTYGSNMKIGEKVQILLAKIYDLEEEKNRMVTLEFEEDLPAGHPESNPGPDPGAGVVGIDSSRLPVEEYWTVLPVWFLNTDNEAWTDAYVDIYPDGDYLFPRKKEGIKKKNRVCMYLSTMHEHADPEVDYREDHTRVFIPELGPGEWGRIFMIVEPQSGLGIGKTFTDVARLYVNGKLRDDATQSVDLLKGYDPSYLYVYPSAIWKPDEALKIVLAVQNDGDIPVANMQLKIVLSDYLDLESFDRFTYDYPNKLAAWSLTVGQDTVKSWKSDRAGISMCGDQTGQIQHPAGGNGPDNPFQNGRQTNEQTDLDCWQPYGDMVSGERTVLTLEYHGLRLQNFENTGEELQVSVELTPLAGLSKYHQIGNVAFVLFEHDRPFRTNTTVNSAYFDRKKAKTNTVLGWIKGITIPVTFIGAFILGRRHGKRIADTN